MKKMTATQMLYRADKKRREEIVQEAIIEERLEYAHITTAKIVRVIEYSNGRVTYYSYQDDKYFQIPDYVFAQTYKML